MTIRRPGGACLFGLLLAVSPIPFPRRTTLTPIRTLLTPFGEFFKGQASSGLVLILAAVLAFAWANSPWRESYFTLRELPLTLSLGSWTLSHGLYWWVNDLLMALFFLLVGLEIKRELRVGELRHPRQASLALFAALGGMLLPAGLYTLVNAGGPGAAGWGVPMATDIAFALGVLALLGDRVSPGLKVLLAALAILDDLGAVLVIALFYTSGLNLLALGLMGAVWALGLGLNAAGVRHLGPYAVLGAALWLTTLASGLHPTVAGVLLALTIPLGRRAEQEDAEPSPLHRLEHGLHPWSAFLILPLFALFNAGVSVAGGSLDRVTLGVVLGLIIGKPLGVVAFAWLAVQLRAASLPEDVTWPGMLGLGLLAGIGFTMALFIGGLAFPEGALLNAAKLGILTASVLAALAAITVLTRAFPRQPR
ncbi:MULTISPECIES: Na+/H+ antiporter NhaA [Deinococcus]|uniref:Na+/H+ antiporter NhaA n=1 Tax=Deinococcus TaxID=1298 RepID=UPI0010556596|nr:Na+/H+ antiporter NhaA [Deinococcus sp. S9]TDE84791.1 Na+/H+ antiporter NhaA [Deinococcus sp. S9]